MLSFLILLIVLGVVLYLVERFIPMAEPFKVVVRVVVVPILIFALLRVFGFSTGPLRL